MAQVVARMQRPSATYKPLAIVVGFNLLTFGVFATAPIAWDTRNLGGLYVLVLSCQALLVAGFCFGRRHGLVTRSRSVAPLSSGDRLMDYLIVLHAATFLVTYAFRMGFSPLDVGGMFDLLVAGVRDRRFGYEMALKGTGLGPVPWTIYFLISVFDQCFFIAGFLQWRKMNGSARVLFAGFVGLDLFFALGRGTSFGVVSMVTTFLLTSLLWARRPKPGTGQALANAMLVFLLFAGSVAFFSYNLYSRSGNRVRRMEFTEFGRSETLYDHPVLSVVPEALQPTYANMVSYLAGGYYHASLALDLDFRSTLLLGNNPALIGLASLVGIHVWEDTYMHRLQAAKGVDEFGLWHSAYTWFASDISFYGVPFLLLGVGYLFGFSWARSTQGDFLSRVVFVILGNILIFLFANNTYLSTMFYSFMFLLPCWMYTRLVGLAPLKPAKAPHGTRPPRREPGEATAGSEALP